MSSDFLFRVRAQQPYESNVKTVLSPASCTPVCVCHQVSVGELCVFVGCAKDELKIGKVLQFSYY